MSKILGSVETIKYAKAASGRTKDVYINWDAIEQLPEEFEAVVTEIRYDPKKLDESFYDIGRGKGPYLPRPELMYKIGDARGIEGGAESINEPVFDEVDWSRVTNPGSLDAPPDLRKIKVGHKVSKFSVVRMEDGTLRRSSICTVLYNVWDRCVELWSKEESFTDGYQKAGRYDNKYQTPFQRRAHLDAEMKFAAAKAETKAHEKTIRELANLMTGYDARDLQSGRLVFCRVQRSREVLKMETAARLSAISRGVSEVDKTATAALFGAESAAAIPAPPEINPDDVFVFDVDPVERSQADILRETIRGYIDSGLGDEEARKTGESIIRWVESEPTPEAAEKWPQAVGWLHWFEDSFVDPSNAIDHGIPRD